MNTAVFSLYKRKDVKKNIKKKIGECLLELIFFFFYFEFQE